MFVHIFRAQFCCMLIIYQNIKRQNIIDMNKLKISTIEEAFERSKKNDWKIQLSIKGLHDADFIYLLEKETKNISMLYLDGNKLSPLSIHRMRNVKWDSLTTIWLGYNSIGNHGCKYLSRISIPLINLIGLTDNQISSPGISHLVKAEWTILKTLYLTSNYIQGSGVKRLPTAKWSKSLKTICLDKNTIFLSPMYWLMFCDIETVQRINAQDNNVEQCYKGKLRQAFMLKYANSSIYL